MGFSIRKNSFFHKLGEGAEYIRYLLSSWWAHGVIARAAGNIIQFCVGPAHLLYSPKAPYCIFFCHSSEVKINFNTFIFFCLNHCQLPFYPCAFFILSLINHFHLCVVQHLLVDARLFSTEMVSVSRIYFVITRLGKHRFKMTVVKNQACFSDSEASIKHINGK